MLRFTVNLQTEEREALVALAQQERRDPRDQAAIIIRDVLRARGLLPGPATGAGQAGGDINQFDGGT